ncbi:PAS domain S-box protein [Azospirillum doebereinerae]
MKTDRNCLSGGGAVGEILRAIDWSQNPLGSVELWPQSLQTAAQIVLGSKFPMMLHWGPDLITIYNDAYAPSLGKKHPGNLGRPAKEWWSEMWDDLAPIFETVLSGEAFYVEDARYTPDRDGTQEEAFFTHCHSPLRDDEGRVAGIILVVTETTRRVVAERDLVQANAKLALEIAASKAGAARLDALIRASSEALYTMSPDWTEMHQLTSGTFLADTGSANPDWLTEYIPVDEQPRVTAAIREAVAATKVFSLEHRVNRASGGVSWTLSRAVPLLDAEGRITEWFGGASDITERRVVEATLRESEARFRNMADHAPVMMWVTDPTGFCTYLNARWYEFTGQTPEEAEGFGWLDATHPDDRAESKRIFLAANARAEPFHLEHRLRTAKGEYRWAIDAAAPRFGPERDFLGYVGSVVDIDAQKRARVILQDQNESLERRVEERTAERDRMWNTSPDLMVILSPEGIYKRANPAWKSVLGYEPSEVRGLEATSLTHPDDLAATQAALENTQSDSLPNFESRVRHRDGSYRWIHWVAAPSRDEIFAFGRHITATKETEEALRRTEETLRQSQKMEAVGQLTGGMAHDFNNLLQAMSGCLQLVGRRAGHVAGVQKILDAGRQAVDRGSSLIRQLMTFSRRQHLQPEAFDVRDRLLGMQAFLDRALRADIRLEFDLEAGLWPTMADPVQFELAVLNLATNARDAVAARGQVVVGAANVELRGENGLRGAFVRVWVQDNGRGIAPEASSRVFEPFFTTKDVGQGTGLGLAQVYGFCRQSGGTALVESAVGRGTTVTLLLPRAEAAPMDETAPQPAVMAGGGARVLLVEDDPVVAPVIMAALEDLGYRVTRAGSGEEALRRLHEGEETDLLFSDVVMPGEVDGIALAQAARRLRPGLAVVLTTGYSESRAGLEGFPVLAKPYRIERLAATLHEVLTQGKEPAPES